MIDSMSCSSSPCSLSTSHRYSALFVWQLQLGVSLDQAAFVTKPSQQKDHSVHIGYFVKVVKQTHVGFVVIGT